MIRLKIAKTVVVLEYLKNHKKYRDKVKLNRQVVNKTSNTKKSYIQGLQSYFCLTIKQVKHSTYEDDIFTTKNIIQKIKKNQILLFYGWYYENNVQRV